jgi:hypothetical protein
VEKQLAFANQQVVGERLPKDKRALAFAAIALIFTIRGGILSVGCPYIGV